MGSLGIGAWGHKVDSSKVCDGDGSLDVVLNNGYIKDLHGT